MIRPFDRWQIVCKYLNDSYTESIQLDSIVMESNWNLEGLHLILEEVKILVSIDYYLQKLK